MASNSLYVSEINLNLEEQVELGRRMTVDGDLEAREKLILNCVPIVKKTARSFSNHAQASYDDLFQEGMMGVMEAIKDYDYTKNVKFSSFAYYRIIHKLSVWVKQQMKYYRENIVNGILVDATISTFQTVFRSYPTDSQLAKLLSFSDDDLAYYKEYWSNPIPYNLRAHPDAVAGRSINFVIATDASVLVENALCKKYNKEHIARALATLDEIDQAIIEGRYLYRDKKITTEALAKQFGVNMSTISRREKKALGKLLKYFEQNGIASSMTN